MDVEKNSFEMRKSPLKFVDLFSGLGGFHLALANLGHKCVFAVEIDKDLRDLYFRNFRVHPASDIRLTWQDVPAHDVLCAGFPCQPFSKAGSQRGFDCPNSGDLFNYVLKILDRRKPKFLLMENVPNLMRHANGETWQSIRTSLARRGYAVDHKELSPHEFGVPQVRHRAVIVAALEGLQEFNWPRQTTELDTLHLSMVLDKEPKGAKTISVSHMRYLEVWEDFLERIEDIPKMPSFPIWSMEFGATYPFLRRSPIAYAQRYLARFKGAYGQELLGKSAQEQHKLLPTYVRTENNHIPSWKSRFIELNREFYALNFDRLHSWLPRVREFPPSFQKFEWNWQGGSRTLWDKVIQLRASGIRVKSPATAPSLVALTTSQIPIIAWERRYMTVVECARLQSLGELEHLPASDTRAFRALGNAINATTIQMVARKLLGTCCNQTFPKSGDGDKANSQIALAA